MDEAKLAVVLERIGDLARYPSSLPTKNIPTNLVMPLLTLEEFFEGNDDEGSIGCNLLDPPRPDEVFDWLKSMRSRPEVGGVYIMVTQYDGPGYWPFSDTVWVVTSAEESEVEEWIPDRFKPDEISTGFHDHYSCERPPIPKGMKPISLWYD